jgi:hypothetical protein
VVDAFETRSDRDQGLQTETSYMDLGLLIFKLKFVSHWLFVFDSNGVRKTQT